MMHWSDCERLSARAQGQGRPTEVFEAVVEVAEHTRQDHLKSRLVLSYYQFAIELRDFRVEAAQILWRFL